MLMAQRQEINFNEDWKFFIGDDPAYCSIAFEDENWQNVDVPHDWSTEGEFSKNHSGRNAWLPGGIAWYRKSFHLPKGWEEKAVEIQFDGVYKNASLWVNQHPVGTQHDGYTSFYYDITELLSANEENIIAVRVDNSIQPNCRWYSGSGIYRNVWLRAMDQTHIANWGTYITTPEISEAKGSVKIETTVENFSESKKLRLESIIITPNGEEIAKKSLDFVSNRYSEKTVSQELSVANPQLWSLEETQQYRVKSILKEGDKTLDIYESKFGFRSIVFDADKGFFLNGENIKMKGVCLHHEAGPLGAAVPVEVWRRRLAQLKSIGCNAIRTAHNPMSPEFMDLCDEMGFLVMDEFVDKWENAYKAPKAKKNPFFDMDMADPNFSTEWKKNFAATIKRDRNRPSVIIWSIGNENHPPGTIAQNQGLRNYGAFVRSLDPTRPVISGMERGRDAAVEEKVASIIESCEFMDLIALNYGEQWCSLIDEQKPGKPYVSTESYIYFNSELEKRFANIERSPWLHVLDNENNMGLFLWVGYDYLGESKHWDRIGADCGLFDYAGFRQPISYLYEAFWSEKPMVHIEVYEGDGDDFSTSGRWHDPPMLAQWNMEDGAVKDIVTYTNCEEVELYLNKKLIARQKLADFPNRIMKWYDVPYEKGTLKAIGYINGKKAGEDIIKTTSSASKLSIKSNDAELETGNILHLEIYLTDKKDEKIRTENKQLNFNIEGDAEILALANGSMKCKESFTNTNSHSTFQGRCLCIVKVNGDFELKVSGEGLKEGVYSLRR